MVVLSLQVVHYKPQKLYSYSRRSRYTSVKTIRCGIAEASGEPVPMGQKTKYNDGIFERVFMTLFAKKMGKFAKSEMKKEWWNLYEYDSFVDVSRSVMQGRSRIQQQQVVREVLLSMLPPGAPAQEHTQESPINSCHIPIAVVQGIKLWCSAYTSDSNPQAFRKLFPPTKWAEEFNAALTVPFFGWLVGPSEVIEVEVNGSKQRSGVHIKKCRYLENSGCVGMCVNMCKIPTQDFFTNEFGLPLTMIPNFEDMSCEMIYGQTPQPFEDDPVSKQPCFAEICSTAKLSSTACHKLEA